MWTKSKRIGRFGAAHRVYAKIGAEKGAFDIADVLNGISDKLIVRHPHIYGDVQADTPEQVKQNWEQIKLKERPQIGV